MTTRFFTRLIIPVFFLSQALYAQPEHPGCCHELGNIFIILNAPLESYLRAYYSQHYRESDQWLKDIHSLDLIIQKENSFYLKKVKAHFPECKVFVKGKKRSLKNIIMNAIVDNTIIDATLIHKEKDLDEYLFQTKKQNKRRLSPAQQDLYCRRLLALAEDTDGILHRN